MFAKKDLILIQIPNLREPAYLIGVASLKSYLCRKGLSVSCFNPVGALMRENVDFSQTEMKRLFSNEAEYSPEVFSESLLVPVIESIEQYLKKEKPKFLGFSLIYGNVKVSLHCVERIKKLFPDLPILLGGPGVKLLKDKTRELAYADAIVHGDGEETLVELLSGKDWKLIQGLEYKSQQLWTKNVDRPSAKDLIDYPQPDYTDFETDPCAAEMLRARPLSLGRGCPFRCRFCAVRNYGSNYRHYDVPTCLDFIQQEVAAGRTHFFVHDPITNGNPGWIREFCQALIDANVNINWGGSIRLTKYLNDSKTLELLFKSGFCTMITGLESAAPNVLRHMKKYADPEIIDEIFYKIRNFRERYPVQVALQLIVGYPNETEEDFQLTLDFVTKHRSVIKEILSCSSFLMIQNENEDLMEMSLKKEFGLRVLSEANWASHHSTPDIRKSRMLRAEEHFKSLNLTYRMFYNEFVDHTPRDEIALAWPLEESFSPNSSNLAKAL